MNLIAVRYIILLAKYEYIFGIITSIRRASANFVNASAESSGCYDICRPATGS